MATARELINSLKSKGKSYAEIGRALGRDSSLISQIARGKKPGANLVGSLQEFAGGKSKPASPQRRKKKSGELAAVRKPKIQRIGTPKKPLMAKASVKSERDLMRELRQIAKQGGKVAIRVDYARLKVYRDKVAKAGTAVLFRHGGIDADTILDEMRDTGESLEEYLFRVTDEQLNPDLAEDMGSIQFAVTY